MVSVCIIVIIMIRLLLFFNSYFMDILVFTFWSKNVWCKLGRGKDKKRERERKVTERCGLVWALLRLSLRSCLICPTLGKVARGCIINTIVLWRWWMQLFGIPDQLQLSAWRRTGLGWWWLCVCVGGASKPCLSENVGQITNKHHEVLGKSFQLASQLSLLCKQCIGDCS